MLFEKGFGYRSVANLLGLSEYTIRDWSRKYKKGEFVPKLSRRCYRYPDTVKKLVEIFARKAERGSRLENRPASKARRPERGLNNGSVLSGRKIKKKIRGNSTGRNELIPTNTQSRVV